MYNFLKLISSGRVSDIFYNIFAVLLIFLTFCVLIASSSIFLFYVKLIIVVANFSCPHCIELRFFVDVAYHCQRKENISGLAHFQSTETLYYLRSKPISEVSSLQQEFLQKQILHF